MSNTFKDNSYHILGLDTTANQKSILKRSKDIINLLKIDDPPEYDLDTNIFNNFRTEESVKVAVQKLNSAKKKIKEYFFWFQIADDVDQEASAFLKNNNFQGAIKVWEKASNVNSRSSFLYKKNLAILLTTLQTKDKNQEILKRSIELWKSLVDSESFWSLFEKIYKLHEEQTASQEVIDDFKNHVEGYLSDIYTELFELHKNKNYVNEFQKAFSAKGEKTEKVLLGPAFATINDAIEKLEKIDLGEYGVIIKTEKNTIREAVKIFQTELNKLNDVGLYDDSGTKSMRDRASEALRKISIRLSYNDKETEFTLELAKEAEKISGTEGTKSRLQEDVKTLKRNAELAKITKPIEEQWETGNSKKALAMINQYLTNSSVSILENPISDEIRIYLQQMKNHFEERIKQYGEPISAAPTLRTINACGTTLYGDALCFVLLAIPIFFIARYSVTSKGGGNYSFQGKLKLKPWQKYWNFGILALLVYVFVISPLLSNGYQASSGASSSNQASSTQTDPWKGAPVDNPQYPVDTRASLEAVKSDLENEEKNLGVLKNQLDSTYVDKSSRQDVADYNALVDSFNAKIRKHKIELKDFNDRVDRFNAQLRR